MNPFPIDSAEHERWEINRRNRIAEGFAFALAASPNAVDFSASDIANHATLFADTLIAELDK